MRQFVKAVVNYHKLKWPSDDYISDYKKFNIKCKILDKDFSILNDKYELCLEGSKEDIESFMSYLRMKGFKFKYF